MDEIIQVKDQFYILATRARLDDRTRVLKHGDTFAVFNRQGDVSDLGARDQGVYHHGTRFLSRFELFLGGQPPIFLSSIASASNTLLAVDLTNPDEYADGRLALARGVLHLLRTRLLWQGCCYEQLRVSNFGTAAVDIALTLRVDADFADIFEVRGFRRAQHGTHLPAEVRPDGVVFGYQGLDGLTRRTRIACDPPAETSDSELCFRTHLDAKSIVTFGLTVACEADTPVACATYGSAQREADAETAARRERVCRLSTSNSLFDEWLGRSLADIGMMVTDTAQGPYPYAGIPWFCTPFGRDGIVTALECLWLDPELARGVLTYLAATQATAPDPARDAEPGKILHEARDGELAALGEIPFGRYYGSVDATPLFVVLAGAYYERTGDRAFVEAIWPHVERALAWIDATAAPTGFLTYARRSSRGLVHQGWKDSEDAVFHADGTLAAAPIALCEVQGYVYAAKRRAAQLAAALDQPERAAVLATEAGELRVRFQRAFWCEDLGTYALALDGTQRPCRVRTSNAGQCLFTHVASPTHARVIAKGLLAPDLYSGWGVRTVATTESRYNPMSYHNGSVWPHDNALIAWGLARYGLKDGALRILRGLFEASLFLDLHRMPELFCGFPRRD